MRVTDPQAIRALAHPLRLDLLELLGTISPATAAQCGRILGVPQANCSFHLRQLAKYGFVEDAGPGEDRRERQWRISVKTPRLQIDSGDDHLLGQQIGNVVVDREMAAIRAYLDRVQDETPEWRDGLGMATAVLKLTAAEAADLAAKWRALLEPYQADADKADARHVRVFVSLTPLGEAQ
ncbi:MAG: helix-turn-helix transcriptional regulator [Hamadaea sp.]|uniref:winged helix-turn-helix domain-containing protein n=1 Tax=Hamadaea sp. TaxID=2024425 RepID=UPI001805BBED|nr:helix-turn-helix domain-containing protein [Hamadaea sp.]NUR73894.1 helix-turn-helix transcriptional regulator [Hamadaea sp.]NUT20638.1 helix-turn-helix transcriptional regulator [Hamadaea sp.]